ncbi:hypothetical protein PtB15_4B620 [Puccinia triticina]|nr:hypothetical protein PtB15_4B620 [Puccinia triticina]
MSFCFEAQHKIEAFRAWHASLPSTLTRPADSQNGPASGTYDCQSWVLINSSKVCAFSKLSEKLQSNGLAEKSHSQLKVLPFDHQQAQSSGKQCLPTVIL